jgi:hypothetical protein
MTDKANPTFFIIWTSGALLIGPLAAVVLPVYARQELGGAGSLAACVTAYGAGGLAGTLAYAVAAFRLPCRTFFVAIWVVYPALTFLLLGLPCLAGVVVVLLAIGFLAGAYDPFEITIHPHGRCRARVSSGAPEPRGSCSFDSVAVPAFDALAF